MWEVSAHSSINETFHNHQNFMTLFPISQQPQNRKSQIFSSNFSCQCNKRTRNESQSKKRQPDQIYLADFQSKIC